MERLRPALNSYHLSILQSIAETLGIEPHKPVQKKQLVDELYHAIQTLASNTAYIQSLSSAEREVLRQNIKLNRVCNHRDVTLPLIKKGLVYIRGLDTTAVNPSIDSVFDSLLSKGLLINVTETTPAEDQRLFEPLVHFAIPPEVQAKLKRRLLPAPDTDISAEVASSMTPSFVRPGNLEEMLRRLFFTWSELRRKPAQLLKSGAIGKRDRRRIATSLGLTGDESLSEIQLLYAVLKTLNLVSIKEKTVEAADTSAVKLFWNTSPTGQVREVLSAYPQIDYPIKYNTKPLRNFSYYGGFNPRTYQEIRRIILDVLEDLAAVTWVPYPFLFALASAGIPGQLILPPPSLQIYYSALRWYGISRKAEFQEQLYDIEQDIVLSVLNEMHTLGLIDFGSGQNPNTQPDVVQLSELLRVYFMQESWPTHQEHGQVILQPDAQLLAMGPVPLSVLANLERVAVREKHDLSVITYRITREGIYLALQRGETLEDIRGYIEDATDQPLPQNIARSLEEWVRQHERIVLHRDIRLLQVASRDVLERLLQDSIINRYIHRLDEKTAWIKNKDSEAFEKRLLELNILPARSLSGDDDLENSLSWCNEQLVSRSPLPSLYVVGTMRLFADEMERSNSQFRWALTEESVKLACSNGYKITDIIKTIEKMTGISLSSEWQRKLKAWGKYYGEGYTVQVRLIRLENGHILSELRTIDRNLNAWLHPLPESEGIAVVSEVHLQDALALLALYGVHVREANWW